MNARINRPARWCIIWLAVILGFAVRGAAASGQFAHASCGSGPNAGGSCVVLEPFVDALPIPPMARPTNGMPGGAATYTIAMREVRQKLHRDLPPTTVWGYGDDPSGATYPGPTIEATTGQEVTVTWVNDLRDATGAPRTRHYLPVDTCLHGADDGAPRTVVHLHGGHNPAEYDGYPEDTLLPGQQAVYRYPNAQLPATLWYHDHARGITRLNVYMGLAGFYVMRDAVEAALDLPAGEFEIPLAIQDRSFAADGSLLYPATWQGQFFGNTILVNGKVWPFLNVKQGKYRFRILNGSNSRIYTLTLSTGALFTQIGSDGGLLPAPVTVDRVTLAPGERADVVVDFASYPLGTEILMTNGGDAMSGMGMGSMGGAIRDVMKFVVLGQSGHTAPIPSALRPLAGLHEVDATKVREFRLQPSADACTGSAWLVNGLRWDDITEYPELGTTEVWSFMNASGTTHPMHLHLAMFQILDRQSLCMHCGQGGSMGPTGGRVPPFPEDAAWKDTVRVEPGEIVRVLVRFEDFKGKYPYHCHILEHEDHEMMRQFQTVSCGDGILDPSEVCDDGNRVDDDGCSATCRAPGSLVIPPCGHANGDLREGVTLTDGVQMLRAAAGLPSTCERRDGSDVYYIASCDMNGDGHVTVSDAVNGLRAAADLPAERQCPDAACYVREGMMFGSGGDCETPHAYAGMGHRLR